MQDFVPLFAEADHDARFGEHGRVEFLHPLQKADGVEITGTRTDRQIVAGHGFHIVVEDVGLSGHDALKRTRLLQEVRGEDFDRGLREASRMAQITFSEMLGATVGEVVAVNGGDDDVGEAIWRTALATFAGSSRSSAFGLPVATLQKAQARVQILTHDHEGRVLLVPALADIRATGFLAPSPVVGANELAGLVIALGGRRLDADPFRLAQNLGIGLVRLFRVTDALFSSAEAGPD